MVGRAGIQPAVVRLKGGFISIDDCDPWIRLKLRDPEVPAATSRSPTMAICATDLTLLDFGLDLGPRHPAPDQCRHCISLLALDVIQLQYHRIGLAAVNAWIRAEPI
jgi:hypothetical protein